MAAFDKIPMIASRIAGAHDPVCASGQRRIRITLRHPFTPVVALAGLSLLAGCVVNAPLRIGYRAANVMNLAGGPLSTRVLFVRQFVDRRNLALDDSSDWHQTNDERFETDVALAVTSTIVEHLSASKLFRGVSSDLGSESTADVVLSGDIRALAARKESMPFAEAAAMQPGSLVGAVAMFETPKVESETILSNLLLVDRATGETIWSGEVAGRIDRESVPSNARDDLERAINASLRAAVDDLLLQLSDVASGAP